MMFFRPPSLKTSFPSFENRQVTTDAIGVVIGAAKDLVAQPLAGDAKRAGDAGAGRR